MLDLFIILLALLLIVLGARGTYQSIWNSIFPQTPITTQKGTSTDPSGLIQQVTQAATGNQAVIPSAGNAITITVPSQKNG